MKKLKITGGVLLVLLIAVFLTWKSFFLTRVLVWNYPSIEDYKIFPERLIEASPSPYKFTKDTTQLDLQTLNSNFREKFGFSNVSTLQELLERTGSTAFLVLRNDTLIYENYFNGYERSSINTSFSTSKSITSAMVGIAIEEGHISDIQDPISSYIPEVKSKGDDISIRDLLTMTSGIAYNTESEILGDEARAYYAPDLREYAKSFGVEAPAGSFFEYNNINPLLVGMVLQRSTGSQVSFYLQEKLWKPIGAEFLASWSLDHSGFEKMESGINARAVDFLKIGRLYLNGGSWNGRQIVPEGWVRQSTTQPPDSVLHNVRSDYGYGYYWWIYPRPGTQNDYWAEGNLGQFIYVSPAANMVIVRHGKMYGYGGWPNFFFKLANELGTG